MMGEGIGPKLVSTGAAPPIPNKNGCDCALATESFVCTTIDAWWAPTSKLESIVACNAAGLELELDPLLLPLPLPLPLDGRPTGGAVVTVVSRGLPSKIICAFGASGVAVTTRV